ncbi:hypothetical protein MYX76_19385, partial [Desulfobacterota bacterium AH_259_B03_O07]|nr:hypothetical protein [Desulfobacterota bacterium AH_259_B03_O07]
RGCASTTPTATPTQTQRPGTSSLTSSGGCSIGGDASYSTAVINLVIPIILALIVGFRMIIKRFKY